MPASLPIYLFRRVTLGRGSVIAVSTSFVVSGLCLIKRVFFWYTVSAVAVYELMSPVVVAHQHSANGE